MAAVDLPEPQPATSSAKPEARAWRTHLESLRRLLVVLGLCLWFGGVTFYTLVVIHTGHRVFDSRVETGFLTQQVTNWLNLIGILALLLMLWNVIAARRTATRSLRYALWMSWAVIAGIEIALFCLHPRLDRFLDANNHVILQKAAFISLHRWYMNLSTTQWATTIFYILCSLVAWGRADKMGGRIRLTE
jgi:hypothetical protein